MLTFEELEKIDRERITVSLKKRVRGGWGVGVQEQDMTVKQARGWRRDDHQKDQDESWEEGDLKIVNVIGTMTQIDLTDPFVYDTHTERLTALSLANPQDAPQDPEDGDSFRGTWLDQNLRYIALKPFKGQCRHCRFRDESTGSCWVPILLNPWDHISGSAEYTDRALKRLAEFQECEHMKPGKPITDSELAASDWLKS